MTPPRLAPPNPSDHAALLAAFPASAEAGALLAALAERRGFEAERVVRRALDWGLAPLAARGFSSGPAARHVPAAARERLALVARLTAVRNGLLLHHLRHLGRRFGEAERPFVVLKGADLMQTVYPDPGCRVSVDLDLLVARPSVDEAEALLRAAGWRPRLDASRDWFDRNLHHGLPWASPDDAVTLELHWDLVRPGDPFPLDTAAFLGRALPFPQVGPTARRLQPPDLLDHLAAHVLRHLNAPDGAFRSLVDIAWVAEAHGAPERPGEPLALALEWCAALRGHEPPGSAVPPLRAAGRRLLAALPDLPVGQAPAVANGVVGLAERDGAGARVRFLRQGLLPAPADAARDLSAGQARRILPLRYLALLANYAGEARRLGLRGLRASWRLGRYRRLLASASAAATRS